MMVSWPLLLLAACGDDDGTSTGDPPCQSTAIEDFRLNGGPDSDRPVLFCMPHELVVSNSQPSCAVVEGFDSGGACSCDAGRLPVDASSPAQQALAAHGAELGLSWDCYCRYPAYPGTALASCTTVDPDADLPAELMSAGYCYLDVAASPPIGDAALLQGCDSSYALRIFPGTVLASGAGVLADCQEYACGG